MSRLPPVERKDLSQDDQQIWDRVSKVRSLQGPSGVLMHAPLLLDRFEAMNDYFRNDAELPGGERELAILATARELDARYAWSRHEPQARAAGASSQAIEAVRSRAPVDGLTPREQIVVQMARALAQDRTLSEELFARARAALGTRQLVELVTLIGHYTLVGMMIRGFAIPVPDANPTF